MEIQSLIIMRSLERIVAIGIGCIFVYLGYCLFIKVPTKEDSEGKFTLPRGWGIHLIRVGPGVFFALFGTAIVVASFLNPMSYQEDIEHINGLLARRRVTVRGATPEGNLDLTEEERQVQKKLHERDIMILSRLLDQLRPDLDERRVTDIKLAIPRIKLAIMKSIWDEEYWGDYDQFEDWFFKGGDMGAPPDNPKEALLYFNLKYGGQSK